MRIEDNTSVTGNYMGKSVSGVVMESRVKYGGDLQYTVKLNSPINFRWREEPVFTVLLNSNEISAVMVNL